MGYATLADLKTAIQKEAVRTDTAFIARLPEWVAMAEARIFRGLTPLRVKEMGKRATLTFADGSVTAPSDFLQARRLTWDAAGRGVRPYFRTPEDFYATELVGGSWPVIFTVEEDDSDYIVDVKPALSGTAVLTYYAEPTALATDTDTHDVLKAHGQIYLFACLIEAYFYLRNTELANTAIQRLQDAIEAANLAAIKARYAGTSLSPRIPGAC